MKKLIAILIGLSLIFGSTDLFGKGGRSGGGFSSSRSSSSRSSSSSKPSSSSSSSSRSSKGFSSSSSTAKQSTNKPSTNSSSNVTSTDTKLYQRAQQQGTVYKTRTDATSAFKTKYGSQYTSKYTTEPSTRPSHIPQTTTVNGTSHTIIYNQSAGGYGYWSGGGPGLGTFLLYDAMTDAVMMSALMSNHGYYYGAAPVATTHGCGVFGPTCLILLIVCVGFVLITRV